MSEEAARPKVEGRRGGGMVGGVGGTARASAGGGHSLARSPGPLQSAASNFQSGRFPIFGTKD